ncbi:AAA family ATPase [Mesorhizobium sp. M1252]|uniref:AAA family ATPase n=1 Tax=Mesorhizobium sp. M1252 TaxID=2957073 RepID=UPI00333DE9A2
MKYVDRQRFSPPRSFSSPEAREVRASLLNVFGESETKIAQTRIETSIYTYSVTRDVELVNALANLFESKCAFCESPASPFSVYRFRPAAHSEPVQNPSTSHLYYSWLAEAWQNLYPICQECRPHQDSYFPVSGKRADLPSLALLNDFVQRDDGLWPDYPLPERNFLLDPCLDKVLRRSLGFKVNGLAVGRSRRGMETIEHFSLNRESLVKRRRSAFTEAIAYTRMDLRREPRRKLPWMEGVEGHEGAIALLLGEAFAIALDGKGTADIDRQRRTLARMKEEGVGRFDQAIEQMRNQDSSPPKTYAQPRAASEADRFDAIAINNYKSLENIRLEMPVSPSLASDFEVPALLLLGENATGKSTILEAIALSVMAPNARERLGLSFSRSVLNPVYLGAGGGVAPSQATLELTYSEGMRRTVTLVRTGNPKGEVLEDGLIPNIPLFAYGAFRMYLDKERKYAPHKHVRSLFQHDEILSNPERWLSGLSDSHFNMVVRALRLVFNIEGSFQVIERTGDGIFVVSQQHESDAEIIRREPISIVSSGFRAVLAMLCDVMQGLMDKRVNTDFQSLETARGLVLIDEVEAHLHPRWKMSIMTGLRKALPRVCFIATSHDPLCLRGMGKEEVMVLERVTGEMAKTDLPVFTQALTNLPDNEKWTVEQLLTADFFQLRSTESTEAGKRAALMEDKLAQGILPSEDPALATYLEEFCRDLPIGHTEVHRLVQGAIAKYLRLKRKKTQADLLRLKAETRSAIVNALRSVG